MFRATISDRATSPLPHRYPRAWSSWTGLLLLGLLMASCTAPKPSATAPAEPGGVGDDPGSSCGGHSTSSCNALVVVIQNTSNYAFSISQSTNHGDLTTAFAASLDPVSTAYTVLNQTVYGPDGSATLYNALDNITMTINFQQNYCGLAAGKITFSTTSSSRVTTLNCTSVEGAYWDGRSGCISCTVTDPGYSVAKLEKKYVGENTGCTWQNEAYPQLCPPVVSYLSYAERQLQKLKVVNGLLCNTDSVPFDTRRGVNGEAIFIMGYDGSIYASNNTATGLFHHSSLYSGSAVASAGTLRVNDGFIVSITNCSGHYKPTEAITMQAVASLKDQGYTESVTFVPCGSE